MSFNIRTIKDLRKLFRSELSELYYEKEIDSVTNIVLNKLLGTDRLHQLTDPVTEVSPELKSRISEILAKLKTGRPLQYILGESEFYGYKIRVNEHVLIPRQETEELVDIIIRENSDFSGRIIDFATGSGCIAVALAKRIPMAELTATDISHDAIELAVENARLNNAVITFIRSDIFGPFPGSITPSEIMVSNPPYVRLSEKKLMSRNVLDFEPHAALFVPDDDPLIFYRRLLEISGSALKPSGKAYFEINETMGPDLEKLMGKYGFKEIKVIRDLNGKNRIIKGRLNG